MRTYQYLHRVAFEETNLVGNVYYVNHLRWQGRCREMFLYEHARGVLDLLSSGLALVTVRCSCEYFEEVMPFEEIRVAMTLGDLTQTRLTLEFDYWRGETLIAKGSQQIACMRRSDSQLIPELIPHTLQTALLPFRR